MRRRDAIGPLLLALLAFLAVAVDGVLVVAVEPVLFGAPWPQWTTAQLIQHYTTICAIWGVSAWLLLRLSARRCGFDALEPGAPLRPWQWAAVACAVAFQLCLNAWQWQGLKVVGEFQKKGLVIFLFQYLYYLFETVLFSLIIVFGQRACELLLRRPNLPWGGILTALTWGLGHIVSKGSLATGLLTALAGFVFGVVYLLVNRDFRKTVLILYLMFAF